MSGPGTEDGISRCGPSESSSTIPLIGRERELEALTSTLVAEPPVVLSVAGVSGSGKTALVREAARLLIERGGWEQAWVNLDEISSPEAIPLAVARALDVEALDRGILQLTLRFRRVILILDGADGVVDELGGVIETLLGCPYGRVVVTSILPVTSPGAVVISLAGLEVPPDGPVSTSELALNPSVRLFSSVAASVDPGFPLDDQTLPEVGRICRALSGLPLALVLAATRVGKSPAAPVRLSRHIQEDPSFGLMLTAPGSRAAHGRSHDTVHEALAWSYSLLDPEEQRVLRRISVFHCPFGLDAAERVCEMSKYDLLAHLESLEALRLLEPGPDPASELTFQMTPLLRAFAGKGLATMRAKPHWRRTGTRPGSSSRPQLPVAGRTMGTRPGRAIA